MRIQLDMEHREIARRLSSAIHGGLLRSRWFLANLCWKKVGRVVPLTYGIDPLWTVTDIRRRSLAASWNDSLAAWVGLAPASSKRLHRRGTWCARRGGCLASRAAYGGSRARDDGQSAVST